MAWIVQYQLNQNGDDAGPHGVDLTPNLDGGNGSWTSDAAGYGLHSSVGSEVGLLGTINSTAAAAISGLQKFTLVVRHSITDVFWRSTPLLDIGAVLRFAVGDGSTFRNMVQIGAGLAYDNATYSVASGTYAIVVDTTQATAANRVVWKVLSGGSLTTYTSDAAGIPQNTAVPTVSGGTDMAVGQRTGGAQDWGGGGNYWFVGLWDDALNDADAEAMLSVLELDHDNDPSGAGPADLHITIPQLMRYSGSAFDDVADEELDVDIYAVDQSTLKVTGLLFSTTVEIPVDPEEPVYLHDNRLGAAGTIRGVAFPYSAAGEDSLAMLMLEVEEGEGHEDDD